MKARDFMTRNVQTVDQDASVLHAVRLMLQRHISGLPVVDKSGRFVGIVTEGDLLRRAETATQRRRPRWIEFLLGPGPLASDYVKSSGRKIHEIMTTEIHTAGEDASLQEIVQMMDQLRLKRVPILRDGTLVGIITRANILRALASQAHPVAKPLGDDTTIRARLLDELKREPWAPVASIDVVVRGGVVTLSGVIADERQRQGLIVAAENIPGVRKVEDQLVWVEPISGMTLAGSAS